MAPSGHILMVFSKDSWKLLDLLTMKIAIVSRCSLILVRTLGSSLTWGLKNSQQFCASHGFSAVLGPLDIENDDSFIFCMFFY